MLSANSGLLPEALARKPVRNVCACKMGSERCRRRTSAAYSCKRIEKWGASRFDLKNCCWQQSMHAVVLCVRRIKHERSRKGRSQSPPLAHLRTPPACTHPWSTASVTGTRTTAGTRPTCEVPIPVAAMPEVRGHAAKKSCACLEKREKDSALSSQRRAVPRIGSIELESSWTKGSHRDPPHPWTEKA